MKASELLAKYNPQHTESYIARIEAALEAKLWGEARKNLGIISHENTKKIDARVCRLWASLEDSENQNFEKLIFLQHNFPLVSLNISLKF